jgi:hypothetical protein
MQETKSLYPKPNLGQNAMETSGARILQVEFEGHEYCCSSEV